MTIPFNPQGTPPAPQQQPAQAPQPQPQYQPPPTQQIVSSEPSFQGQPQFQQPQQQQQNQQITPQQQRFVQPQQQPPQNWPQPQQPAQQQPQFQPQPQQPQQQGHGGIQIGQDGRILPAQGVPQELVGKTLNEMFQMYGMVRQGYLNATQQQLQPQAQPQAQPQQQQQQQPQQPKKSFWTNPEEVLGEMIDRRLQPVVQQSIEQQITRARESVANLPDYMALESEVINRLRGASPELLANPETWRSVYLIIRGEQSLRQGQSQQFQQPNNGFHQIPVPQVNQQQQMPSVPAIPNGFFTETPTPFAQTPSPIGQATPAQIEAARRMGVPIAQYLAAAEGRF